MLLSTHNMCKAIEQATTGDGFRRTRPIDILSELKVNTTGLVLTGSTVPKIAVLEGSTYGYGVVVAGGQTGAGVLNWTVPADYDDSKDELRIRLAANRSGATAGDLAKTINAAIYRKRPIPSIIPAELTALPAGLALSADLGIPAGPVVPALNATPTTTWIEINADYWTDFTRRTVKRTGTGDVSIKAGDILTIALSLSATMTDDVNIYGAAIWYRTNLAFTDKNSR